MTVVNELQADINQILSYGEEIRFKYYNASYGAGSYYDDDVTLTLSGTTWTSGLILPIDNKMGGYDALLLQQGKITIDDKKVYVDGTVQTSGLGPVKIGMTGSPTTKQYEILNQGQVTQWHLNGSPIYKKIYVRFLPNGSFLGE